MPSSSGQVGNSQNNRQFIGQRDTQQRNYFPQRNSYNPRQNEGQKRFRSWNNNPNNERKWNSRPMCNFCKKTGHFAFNCFERRRRFNQNWRPNMNAIQEISQSPGPSNANYPSSTITVDANELLRAFASMKILPSGSKSCKDSETINSISRCTEKPVETKIEKGNKIETEKVQEESIEAKRPRTSNWEGIGPKVTKFLMIINLLAMSCSPALSETISYMPKHPMVCQNVRDGTLWSIPMLKGCPRVSLDYTETPSRKTLWLYSPNTLQQETNAWACRKIRKSLRKFTTLTNVNVHEQLDPEPLELTTEECRQMIYHRKCKVGTLIEENGLWHTNMQIDNSPRTWLLGSWNWKVASSENCYLIPIKIFSKFGDESISSPLGETKGCPYESGSCKMLDKTLILWKPSNDTNCEYKPMGPWKGHKMGTHWIADKAPLLLEFPENTKTVIDCRRNLTLSTQGYAAGTQSLSEDNSNRVKRAIEGLVTSSQLASELSYLSWNISSTLSFSFAHAMHSVCEYVEQNRRWAIAASTSDPTMFARVMFNNPNLMARKVGPNVIKIWPCAELEPRQYSFVPLEEINPAKECFELIPIKIDIGGEEKVAFVNPENMIIRPTSRKAPCQAFRKQIIRIDEDIFEIDQVNAMLTKINVNIFKNTAFDPPVIPSVTPISFHQIVLTNITDFLTHSYVSNVLKFSRITFQIHKEDMVMSITPADEWKQTGKELRAWIIGDLEEIWWKIVSVLVLISTADIILRIYFLIKGEYKEAGNIRRAKNKQRALKQNEEIQMSETRPGTSNELETTIEGEQSEYTPIRPISEVGFGIRQSTRNKLIDKRKKPRKNSTRARVNAIGELPKIHSITSNNSTILAKINTLPIRCLVDTGSSVTVAPMSVANNLGCNLIFTNESAVSASGHLIAFSGKAEAELEVAGQNVTTTIHFVENSKFSKNQDYQLILGCDSFKKLPPLNFDFQNQKLYVGQNWTELGLNRRNLFCGLRAAATEDFTVPPSSQAIVKAQLESIEKLNRDVVVDSPDINLIKNNLGIVPCVATPLVEKILLAIINPTNEPKSFYKGMHLAYVNEISEENGILSEQSDEYILSLKNSKNINIDPTYKVDLSKSDTNEQERKSLESLIDEFSDIFSKSQYDLGSFTGGEHHFYTTTDEPVFSAPRKMPYKYRDELKQHIDQLLKAGVMIESNTPWVTPFVVVQKKDGGIRPCLDFRKLNEVMIPDRYPLPRLDAIMEKIGNCNYYSSIDLASGYMQIKLSDETSWKCGVITEDNVYQMKYMPFGLKNATAAFSRAMAVVLCGLEECALSYVDDVLVYTKDGNFDDHLTALRKIFKRFRIFNLKLSPKKCSFASKKMNFLGFTLTADGYKPSLSRIEILKDMPAPKTVKEVKIVLGKIGFYRRHIPNFSTIVEPLLRLSRRDILFTWNKEQQEAYDKIKDLLSRSPNLIFPDYSKPFHIFTDASLVGLGGVLMQKNEETGTYSAISYCSRTLSSAERRWPPVQVELCAIIYALREFKAFIFMSDIELHTDHKPLAYLLKKSETHPHLARWLIELQNYQIKLVHISGKENTLADALSRDFEDVPIQEIQNLPEMEDIVEFPVCLAITMESRVVLDPFVNTLTLRHAEGDSYKVDLIQEQKDDPEIAAFIRFIRTGEFPEDFDENEKDQMTSLSVNLCINSDILYFKPQNVKPRIFVPISLRSLIFESFHNSPLGGGHMNVNKTLKKCSGKYFWPMMRRDIMSWVRLCITCQLRHNPSPAYRAEMKSVPVNTLCKSGIRLGRTLSINN
ncbi:hypothetical protein ACQ4LE_008796 [Meloidogyne hapla]